MESFSQQVKDEIVRNELPRCQNCLKAELAAIIHMAGSLHLAGRARISLSIVTELAGVARRIVKLLKAVSNLEADLLMEDVGKLGKLHRYSIVIPPQPALAEVLTDLGIISRERSIEKNIQSQLVKDQCCRASFLRGAFLAGGSLTDPLKKTYHLELVSHHEEFADGLAYLLNLLNIKAKITQRKERYLVYLKESDSIARFLSLVNAYTGVIKLEEVKVIKGLRSEVNRRVNCETANLEKSLAAAWEQVELINRLREKQGLANLPENLRITAQLRLEHPEANLKELGEFHSPPVSKSAVNHRLRLIREFAKNFLGEAGI